MTNLIEATVISLKPLNDCIVQVILRPKNYIAYQAGHYLQLRIGADFFSYSIANAPLGLEHYELHIRHRAGNSEHQGLLAMLKPKMQIMLRLPFGQCDWTHLDLTKPLLFMAQGTGFSPIKAILEQLWSIGHTNLVELFWSSRVKSDLYMEALVQQWVLDHPGFNYFSYPADPHQAELLAGVFARYKNKLHEREIVLSGPFDRVYQARDQLILRGAIESMIHSDAFEFEE